jgi:predicted dehydrogenase/nucleoside-diphosphate-sugar epimerase
MMKSTPEPRPARAGRDRLRVVVVGAGYVSRHHLKALRTLDFVDVVAIVDPNLEQAAAVARSFRVADVEASLSAAARHRPDCAYILTPPSTHCDLALQAMDMGCDVLVEKPMAETPDDCRRMIDRARSTGRVLSVNHSDLFDPVVRRALEVVRSGAVGVPLTVDVIRSSDYAPYAGGPLPGLVAKGSYPFQDIGVHALYQLEAFLGPIAALDVGYRSTGLRADPRFDEWTGEARCERGVGRLQLSWNTRPMQNRIVVQCTRGVVEVDKFLQTCTVHRSLPGPKFVGIVLDAFVSAVRLAVVVPINVLRFATGRLKGSPGIFAMAAEFATRLRDGRPPAVAAEDAARIVELMKPVSDRADAQRSAELEARHAPLEPCADLVTGANGFLGAALVERLLGEDRRVRVLVRRAPDRWSGDPRVQVVIGDLGDPRIVDHAVAGVQRVFHVGAAMKGAPEDFRSGTVWGTRNVVEACLAHGVERLVHVSSMSVLDHAGRDPSATLTEDARLEPAPQERGQYTQTKLAAERIVAEAIATRGLRAVVLRPGQIFGPGAERVTPNGVIGLGRRWICVGPGDLRLPLVYRDDAVDAIVAAGSGETAIGRTIHVVDTKDLVDQRTYLSAAGRFHGDAVSMRHWPRAVVMALASGVELLGRLLRREVPLTRYRVRSLRPLDGFDTTLARETLGWSPRVGSLEGLSRTFGRPADEARP